MGQNRQPSCDVCHQALRSVSRPEGGDPISKSGKQVGVGGGVRDPLEGSEHSIDLRRVVQRDGHVEVVLATACRPASRGQRCDLHPARFEQRPLGGGECDPIGAADRVHLVSDVRLDEARRSGNRQREGQRLRPARSEGGKALGERVELRVRQIGTASATKRSRRGMAFSLRLAEETTIHFSYTGSRAAAPSQSACSWAKRSRRAASSSGGRSLVHPCRRAVTYRSQTGPDSASGQPLARTAAQGRVLARQRGLCSSSASWR